MNMFCYVIVFLVNGILFFESVIVSGGYLVLMVVVVEGVVDVVVVDVVCWMLVC